MNKLFAFVLKGLLILLPSNLLPIDFTSVSLYADKIKVEFKKIQVVTDGDSLNEGEFSFEFKVDNDVVVSAPPSSTKDAADGESISLDSSYVIERHPSGSFSVQGSVTEIDDTLNFDNDYAGSFTHTYSGSDANWNQGDKSVRLSGDDVEVTVYYKITLIEYKSLPPSPVKIHIEGNVKHSGSKEDKHFEPRPAKELVVKPFKEPVEKPVRERFHN